VPREFLDDSLPAIATEEVPRCIVCGAATSTPFASGYDYELRTCRNEWQFVQCASCAHVWLNPRPAIASLEVIYPKHYYAYDYESRINPAARWAKSRLDARKFRRILKHIRQPRSFLDIGCGSGRYLRTMKSLGLGTQHIHGVELDDNVVGALQREGFSVQCARAEDAMFEPASLDLVTMFHVIEHVDSPDKVVRRIAEWVPPGGVLAIETPNLDSLDQRLFSKHLWGGYHIPRHWHLFTAATLARLLRDAGFEPRETIYQTGHSFWMYSLHHYLRYAGRPRPGLARLFDPFSNVVPLAAFTGFDMMRASLGAKTSAMLMVAERVHQ
jgi:2-polyprenyl-3-methyl-5-hydroxy-6-metoxy-1,4-benzoquinol methylase